jgi:hypothetical protein
VGSVTAGTGAGMVVIAEGLAVLDSTYNGGAVVANNLEGDGSWPWGKDRRANKGGAGVEHV